jgi:hypothetical protein
MKRRHDNATHRQRRPQCRRHRVGRAGVAGSEIWSGSTCAPAPARASRCTRSGRCCPGPLTRSLIPWTSWSASGCRAGRLRPDTCGHAAFLLQKVNDTLLIVMLAWCRSGGVAGSAIGGVVPYPVFTLTGGDDRRADRATGSAGAHRGLRHHDPPAGRANRRPLRPDAPSWQP